MPGQRTSWFDWKLVAKHADVHRFVRLLWPGADTGAQFTNSRVNLQELLRNAVKAWHGIKLDEPDWGDGSLSVALSAELREERLTFYIILNAYWEPLTFQLPPLATADLWRRWIDISLIAPDDISPWKEAPPIPGDSYTVAGRSVAMLYSPEREANKPQIPDETHKSKPRRLY